MALLTLHNFNSYTMLFNHEELAKPIAMVNDIILKIMKSRNSVFIYKSFFLFDNATFVHSVNVSLLTLLMAREMGYKEKSLKEIAWGAFLHDLGKLMVPECILNKPGKLTKNEYELIKKHPEYGMKLIEPLGLSVNICMAIAQHHERWEGTGYPLGLKGKEIHPLAQIVAVADTFDALISDRPYRKGMPVEKAIEIVRAGKGTDFSPKVVDQLLKLLAM
ncbi:HD-GYP domain-containing protein [Desulfitobacterium metallireducens]|uniref:Uncharacterized protein n=1 Tax=Desulfitobacterium metallireducens DSM 15288 TaxID=871968 RepID=W0E5V0_9FIRM|nr:HD-GYP domain-containing protein [Desulfitobacterium metallireducens]AHF06132.1 hypothetical protein DESME_02950 [Desulfitobacterium metallireducens DSM 15288]